MISTMKNLESLKKGKRNAMELGFFTNTQKTMTKLPNNLKVKYKPMEDINGRANSKKKSLKRKLMT